MSKNNVITIKHNTLEINYFSNNPGNDWIPFGNIGDGIFYKPTLVKYPYIAQDNQLIKFDDKEQINIYPFNFIIQENSKEQSVITARPYNFILSENLNKVSNGTPVLEIRTKNSNGQWQDWQAIIGTCNLYKIYKLGTKDYLCSPIENELENFKKNLEIRHSGFLFITSFNDIQIIGNENIIKTFSTHTRKIEFYPDSGNTNWSHEDRCKTLGEFIDKYHRYDSAGNRI
ncbi:hypothetical protein [Streptococcus parauberis]|uniref:hypothetical protein n=1 Tax=Streptococcus parauberis TaxID=1348 RepID=UPI000C1CB58F|nr:hypothetical protein [Streptococcus parauberis]PIO78101.1 hypothetical protein ADO05_01904 [Streptococcus parauberis]POS68384.1 hypothetical protein AOS90_00064 [Streptococcus parauberis]